MPAKKRPRKTPLPAETYIETATNADLIQTLDVVFDELRRRAWNYVDMADSPDLSLEVIAEGLAFTTAIERRAYRFNYSYSAPHGVKLAKEDLEKLVVAAGRVSADA